jgi:hypothetical protein
VLSRSRPWVSVHSRTVVWYWLSPAQLSLVSGPVGTHDHIFVQFLWHVVSVGCEPLIGNLDHCQIYWFSDMKEFIWTEVAVWLLWKIMKWMLTPEDTGCRDQRDHVNKYILEQIMQHRDKNSLDAEKLQVFWHATSRKFPCWRIYKPPEIRRGIYLQIFSRGSHAVTQLQHQSLVRISSPECPKYRQILVCVTFSFNKFIIYLQPKIFLWAKPFLNGTLPSDSAAIWTEQHLLGSSVSGYLYLEDQGSNNA